jgi:outer membrane lipoprotein-sorting protein
MTADAASTKPPDGLDSDSRIVLRAVSDRYKKLKNWEATFLQETFSLGLGKGTVNEGRFHFVGPNRFKFSLTKPEASDFISDGKSAWYLQFREGRDKAAHVRSFKDVSKVEIDRYLLVLRGIDAGDPAREKKLLSDFVVKGTVKGDDMNLALEPRTPTDIVRVTLGFKKKGQSLEQAVIEDAVGNTTTLRIVTWQPIKKVDSTVFKPKIPSGSQVEEL